MNNADKFIRAFKPYLHGKPSGDEWRAYCPLHEDPQTSKSPSASFNFESGLWHCNSCDDGGSIRMLFRTMVQQKGMKSPKKDRSNVIDINTKEEVKTDKPLPSMKQIKFWHKSLMGKTNALRVMTEKRGLNKSTLKEHLIGWDGNRFTLPVYDEDGELVNVRRYKPNARKASDKMVSWGVGYGTGRIIGFDVLEENDEVYLAEGEWDRLIALQEGMPAVTHTSGASVFKMEWAKFFKDKIVYVGYDEDKAGDTGAMKAATVLKGIARAVVRVKLGTGIDGGDTTDFYVKCGGDTEQLWQLCHDGTPLYEEEEPHEVPTSGRPVSVEESQSVEYDEPLELTVMVAGKQTPPFVVPKTIEATCTMSAGAVCSFCPLALNDGNRTIEVDADDATLLKFINASDKRKAELYQLLTGAKCNRHVEFASTDTWSVEEMIVTPSIEHRSEDTEVPIHRKVYNVGTYKTPINQLARIVGKQTPDPMTQRGTFMSWGLEPVNSDLEDFEMTPGTYRRLRKFQPKKGVTPLQKSMRIAHDLSSNVTHIYGRELMHVALDLTWHSVIGFTLAGKDVQKGWLECLILGDTRTGKTEATNALRKHYGAGVVKSCEGATFAGLVGGAQKMGRNDQWMVTWGTIPLNDRRLVALDEMSGLMANGRESKGIIENMSSIRSEGRAEITKIANEETSARTRLIWLSNTIDRSRIADSPEGALNALRRLVRNPEDIARFDYVMAVANNEVDSSLINSVQHDKVHHRYNAESCELLIMWAWSRRADQVRWAPGAEESVYAAAEDVGGRYVADPPLVQVENIRVKLARLAVAFAARTFSTNARGELLIVRKAHVKSAVEFLDAVYGSEAMGYARYSERLVLDRDAARKNRKPCMKYLRNNPELLGVLRGIGSTTFRPRDFEEQAAIDRDAANEVVRRLIEWRMITRLENGRMKMEPELNRIIRELET